MQCVHQLHAGNKMNDDIRGNLIGPHREINASKRNLRVMTFPHKTRNDVLSASAVRGHDP